MAITDLIFYIGISLLITHELDAIRNHEWRVFPILSQFKDDVGYYLFSILHVPLLVVIFWFISHPSEDVRFWFQISMDGFFIVHMLLHKIVSGNKKYEFRSRYSRALILSIALIGVIHIALLLSQS